MSPTSASKAFNKLKNESPAQTPEKLESYHLSSREDEILVCLVDGLSYKKIAAKLCNSYKTVRSHVKNIYEKLHLASLTEAVTKAIKQ